LLACEEIDGGYDKRPQRGTTYRRVEDRVTKAVFINNISGDIIVQSSIKYWIVVMRHYQVIKDAYKKSQAKNAYDRSICF
jgi:hypothetical protein